VLSATPLAVQAKRRREAIESNDFPPRFTLALARKDAGLVASAAPGLRLARAARSWLADADAASWGATTRRLSRGL
jgi:3-hydroxyisobutyrate dehydrogenase-like beta-hydroxyacid dehydrogenase